MKAPGARVSDLLKLVQRDYEINGKRSKPLVDMYIRNQLAPKLGARIAEHVRKSHVEDYKSTRKKEGASEVTVNRELAILKRAFTLGIEDELVERKPVIKLYPEPEPREGHYEHDEFLKFQDACRQLGAGRNYDGEVTADIVLFAYYSGWRLRECLGLHKDWIKPQEKLAVLPRSKHKNKRPKIYPLEGKVWHMIERRLVHPSPDGLLFHRSGKPVRSIRRICSTVCDLAKIENKEHFFHNLRRSCTTNLNRAGVDKETGKKITGHKTDTIYNNYNQHSIESVRNAVKQVEAYLDKDSEELTVAIPQVGMATENQQGLPEVMAERAGFEPANRVSDYLISSQQPKAKPVEQQGFFTRLWRTITRKADD